MALRRRRPTLQIIEVPSMDEHAAPNNWLIILEQLKTGLSKSRTFHVVTNQAGGLRPDRKESVPDYCVQMRWQRTSDSMLCFVGLVNNANSRIIWSEMYRESSEREELFGTNMIVGSICSSIESEVVASESEHMSDFVNVDVRTEEPHHLLLKAIPAIGLLEKSAFIAAGDMLDQAVRLDPSYVDAHNWYAYWHVFLVGQGWARNAYSAMRKAEDLASRALLLDPKDSRGFTIAGHVQAFLHRNHEKARALHDRALGINPGLAKGWHYSGMAYAYDGDLEMAHRQLTWSLKLAPFDHFAFLTEHALATVLLLQGSYEEALRISRIAAERQPHFSSGLKTQLAILGHLGRKKEAESVLQRLLGIEPRFSLRAFRLSAPYRRERDIDNFTIGIRKAGVV
jgi:tetratricopeptide (TPR) repeat protein